MVVAGARAPMAHVRAQAVLQHTHLMHVCRRILAVDGCRMELLHQSCERPRVSETAYNMHALRDVLA